METEKDLKTQKELLKQQLQAYQRLAKSVESEKFISNEIRKCINYELRQISLKLRFTETKEKIIQKYKKFPLTIQCGKYFSCVFDQYDLNFECNFNLNEKINSYLSYIWPYYPENHFDKDDTDDSEMYYDYQEFGSCSKIQIEHAHAFKYEINFMFNDFVKNLLTPVPVKSSWNKDDPEIIFDMINYIKSNKKMWEYVDNYIALLVSNENKNWQEEAEIVYKKLREYEKNHQESSSSEKDFEDFEF